MVSEPLRAYGRRVLTSLYPNLFRAVVQIVVAFTVNLPLFILAVLSIAFIPLGVGVVLAPVVFQAIRSVADQQRTWAAEWSGVAIPSPYRPEPAGAANPWRRLRWLLADPASWRDLVWTILNVPVALVLGVLAGGLAVYGLEGVFLAPWLALISGYGWGPFWPLEDWGAAGIAGSVVLGAALVAVGGPVGPFFLKAHALFGQSLLAPTRAALAARVEQLAESRSETVDASAAELRRIERDLHDGAQARLVALSMSIGLAEEMMKHDPEMAAKLLAEARESSGTALTELRDLVRGIHPPVLAERGLDGAVRALALTLPLPVEVRIDLSGRPGGGPAGRGRLEAPVESAAYFAVAEMLANVVKHSRARRAWLQIEHSGDRLIMIIGDDGTGGADPAAGSGMGGIERRLAAFDGTMAVTSPPGGPTVVTMELPCALSSPRTSPSSGTG
ncbi:sensor histidine kinase [Actinomadura sp. LD22]|uniref:histidine kinase n=1 Tax=Actinomadura physcomitrii TaxID=2650748 RepID=A0A6I4MJ30_9ACTN|nr:sensor histidine kinase [Actinomadura physcomitrii]MWA06198.1 sensor histidine kinase [Actinomadura physcomitrii]